MIFRVFSHYLILPLFLLGTFFSCPAFADMIIVTDYMNHDVSDDTEHDCCPKDGHHASDIDGKVPNHSFIKDDTGRDLWASLRGLSYSYNGFQIQENNTFRETSHIDKQHLFFIETIRLLL